MENTKNKPLEYELVKIDPSGDVYFEHYFDQGRLVSNHWHNDIELILLLNGELDVSMGKQTLHYKQDDIILINSQVVHSTICTAPNESILVQIPYPFLKRYIPDMDDYIFTVDCFSEDSLVKTKLLQLKETLQQMLLVNEYHPDGGKLQFTSLLFKLLYQLYHNFRTQDFQSSMQKKAKDLNKLEPVLDYIQEHYTEPLSLREIAHVAGFQFEYFCRLFKKNMGLTCLEYMNEIRLSHFYNDLIATDHPIQYLLDLHGFTNYKLFRKLFAAKFHTTPSQLRQSLQS
ncbi:MAG: AraC family transcriptional regulator [Lachnospiraceae bacterium]|nr:AraC family transcriptional regulator [Lachnospiraceae bacterium]